MISKNQRRLRDAYKALVRAVEQDAWSNARTAARDVLGLLSPPIERWNVSGTALKMLGQAELALTNVTEAKAAFEASLRCTLIDIRTVFPLLADAARRAGVDADARSAIYELLVASGAEGMPDADWALDLRARMPPPPNGGTWTEYEPIDAFWLDETLETGGETEVNPLHMGGKQPLHVAADRGDGYTIAKLLNEGADPNARWQDEDRIWVPLQGVVYRERPDLVRLLLEHGAKIAAPTSSIVNQARSSTMARLLIESGAPLDGLDHLGRTPLLVAVQMGRAGVVEELLAAGADDSVRTEEGMTLTEFARRSAGEDEDAAAVLRVLRAHQLPRGSA